jgi:hypothetical protein
LPDDQAFVFQSPRHARFQLGGELGERIRANVGNWLLPAPVANPGMIEMFRLRDQEPAPNLVPWAGEFAGKYLISAIQAQRLTESEPLSATVGSLVAQLIATQAEDGYLGPFPKAQRLKGNWDLWGHYHCLLALLMWHEATGDAAALRTCRRAADLMCNTFLDTNLRVYDAGSHEMNMAVIHALGWLYRLTKEPRYLRMMREIEKDWERAGDYLRSGLDGREFYQTPRPRWESLHDLQGLVELYRITGDAKYRQAFEHHWRSIRRWDVRNSGGFSSGEQATGNPYAPTAIETCCTVAWMALSVDMLRLTGDARVADALELATYNAAAGAQHPSGRWWTYNTPMDGVREASAHTIVFQARAGTPELNCCSVNGPRSFGLLSEWAVMLAKDGLVVNYYGPGVFEGTLADGTPFRLRCDGDYPLKGSVRLKVERALPEPYKLHLRIPQWSTHTVVQRGGAPVGNVRAGSYLALAGLQRGDFVALEFDMKPRFVPGDKEAAGKVSVYCGPVLFAYDQRLNGFRGAELPQLDLNKLSEAEPVMPRLELGDGRGSVPWLVLGTPTRDTNPALLCDFASAGAAGTRYRSWLPAADCPPPPVVTARPADGAAIPAGKALFRWSGPQKPDQLATDYRLVIFADADGERAVLERAGIAQTKYVLGQDATRTLTPGRWYYWEVISRNAHGTTENPLCLARFRVDTNLPPVSDRALAAFLAGPPEVLAAAALRGDPNPQTGILLAATPVKSVAGPRGQPAGAVEFDGVKDRLVYQVEEWPEEDFSVSVWVQLTRLPEGRLGQVFSAWAAGMDDPLRICVDGGKLFARIEAGQGYSTEGVAVATGTWFHVAAVKSAAQLTLFVNGEARASTHVPATARTVARDFALGGNPHYGGNEFLAVQLADFAFYARVLATPEVKRLATRGQ